MAFKMFLNIIFDIFHKITRSTMVQWYCIQIGDPKQRVIISPLPVCVFDKNTGFFFRLLYRPHTLEACRPKPAKRLHV